MSWVRPSENAGTSTTPFWPSASTTIRSNSSRLSSTDLWSRSPYVLSTCT